MDIGAVFRVSHARIFWRPAVGAEAFDPPSKLWRVRRPKEMLNAQVTYRWRDSKTNKLAQRSVSGVEFLRLVLQHVLPKGFRRARNYGFLHPNSKRLIALLRLLVFKPCVKATADSAAAIPAERPKLLCRCCGAVMAIVRRRILPLITPPGCAQREEFAGA
jgi:hypothetical protein